MSKKLFKEISVGEKIYTMNPLEGTILALLVSDVIIPKNMNPLEWVVIKYWLIKPIPNQTVEQTLAQSLSLGKIPNKQTLIAPRNLETIITNHFPPLIYSTSSEALESWSQTRKKFFMTKGR